MLFKRAAALLLLVAGCGRCGGADGGGGPTPYARCLEAEPVSVPPSIGGVTFQVVEDRVLELGGLPQAPRVAVFQGPGMVTALPHAGAVGLLVQHKPDLILILGGLGTDQGSSSQWVGAIAKLGRPVLFLAGGRDKHGTLDAVREALPPADAERLIDLTSFVGLRGPGFHWVLVAGSELGRESIDNESCGFAESDLADRLDAARSAVSSASRTLVSWEIPRGPLGGSGERLPEVGSAALAALRHDLGDIGGLHAWPDTQVMRPTSKAGGGWGAAASDLQLVVPRLFGPAHERGDGTRHLPSFAIVAFSSAGMIAELPR